MSTKNKLIISIGVVCVVLLAVFWIVPGVKHTDSTYTGQIIFTTTEEFESFKSTFKQEVLDKDLKVNSFDVIASEPPIIVNFDVGGVAYDDSFPFGYTTSHSYDAIILTLFIAFASLLIFLPLRISNA